MRRRSVLALIAAAAVLPAEGLVGAEGPGFAGSVRWATGDTRVAGISAIHLFPDGLRLLALSDRGRLIVGRLERDADGRVLRALAEKVEPLRDPAGAVMPAERADSEGIAVGADGRIYISFEGRRQTRVWSYARPGAAAEPMPDSPAFRRMRGNKALEALAIDAEGRLHTLPEDVEAPEFPLFRLQGGAWSVIAQVPRAGSFLPVGADFGPDGRFYLLERDFTMPLGFASRLRRFVPGRWDVSETLIQTRTGRFGNLEGVSVTRDAQGNLRATMVSDDNFLPFQRSEIIEFRLPA